MLTDNGLHDNVGYNPFSGRRLRGWPETVLRRGDVIIADGRLQATPGSGRLQLRGPAASMRPTGRLSPEFDPQTNFGAHLL
jgi:dihydropyrimidinase